MGSFNEVLDAPPRPAPVPVEPRVPTPASNAEIGERVWVVFWRTSLMPSGEDIGGGDFVAGRVIYPGLKKVCFAPDNPLLPSGFGDDGDSPENAPVRFADPKNVYATREDAVAALVHLKPPARR